MIYVTRRGGGHTKQIMYCMWKTGEEPPKGNSTEQMKQSEAKVASKIGKLESLKAGNRLKAEGNGMKSEKGNKANQAQTLSGRYTSSYILP